MITQTYQKTYEGDNLTAATNGVLILNLLKDSKITSIKVGVREANLVGNSNFEVKQGATVLANVTLGVGVIASTVDGLDFDYLEGDPIILNLLGANGGVVVTPIYLQIEVEEVDFIAALPNNPEVIKSDAYLTRKADGSLVKTFPLQIKGYFGKSTVPVPITGGNVDIDAIDEADDAEVLTITSTSNITSITIAEGKKRFIEFTTSGGSINDSGSLIVPGGNMPRKAGLLVEVVGLAGGVAEILSNNYPQSIGDPDLVGNKTFVKTLDFFRQIEASAGLGTTSYVGADLIKILMQGAVGVGSFAANFLKLGGLTVLIGDIDTLANGVYILVSDGSNKIDLNANEVEVSGFLNAGQQYQVGGVPISKRPVIDNTTGGNYTAALVESGSIIRMPAAFILELPLGSTAEEGETVYYVTFETDNNDNIIRASGSDEVFMVNVNSGSSSSSSDASRLLGGWMHEVRYQGGGRWCGTVLGMI